MIKWKGESPGDPEGMKIRCQDSGAYRLTGNVRRGKWKGWERYVLVRRSVRVKKPHGPSSTLKECRRTDIPIKRTATCWSLSNGPVFSFYFLCLGWRTEREDEEPPVPRKRQKGVGSYSTRTRWIHKKGGRGRDLTLTYFHGNVSRKHGALVTWTT